jgi:radical SAM superfamily enzyme YgiQ (UPF0313 family)
VVAQRDVRQVLDSLDLRRGRERGPAFVPGDRRVAMVYPSPYRAGMSSLGYQWITTRLRAEGIAAERCFYPDDLERWRASGLPPLTEETRTSLAKFPLWAISFAYELELPQLLALFELAGVPALAAERRPHHPRVLLGGPITMASPLALAPFVDAVLLGEGEEVAPAAVLAFFDAETREGWLNAVAALPGGWVPERGPRLPPLAKATDATLPARSAWLTPDAELSDMFLLEAERGCHRMCTFCVMRRTTNGGMRLVQAEHLLSLIPEEARKVGLVGAAVSDHPELPALLRTLVDSGRQVSVSSLRADQVAKKPDIARLLRQTGARTLTVASDGASERIRRELIKKTQEEHLLAGARQAGQLGYDHFKVYMMLGLPGEEEADLDELVRFTRALSEAAGRAKIILGVAPFVAKKNTPLDGQPFAGIKVVEHRLARLGRELRGQAEVRPVSARWAWVEYELSQGGPEVGLAMLEAYRAGNRFADVKRALLAVDPETRRPWARLPVAAK